MGNVIAVSGWNDAGHALYGKKFADTFAKFWPPKYQLAAYTESPVDLPRGECRSLWTCPGVADFIDRHKDNPVYCGRKDDGRWAPRQKGRPYNFRFDAVKFCRQMFIPSHASAIASVRALETGRDPADDFIVWLDGDVITHRRVADTYVESTLDGHDLCYLGRTNAHSEIGFWACRNNDRGRIFLDMLAKTYDSDSVFKLPEWHSAWVFDHCRLACERNGLRSLNMTPRGTGHVWFQSSLREFSDHLKGDTRKKLGRSAERVRA